MIRIRTIAAAAALAIGSTMAAVAPADAEPLNYEEVWYESGTSNNLGYVKYDPTTEKLYVNDQEKDGYSMVAVMDGPWAANFSCWDSSGRPGNGVVCDLTDAVDKWGVDGDDADVELYLGNAGSEELVGDGSGLMFGAPF